MTGVAAGAERGSGVNRHAVGENAPTAASVIVGDEDEWSEIVTPP